MFKSTVVVSLVISIFANVVVSDIPDRDEWYNSDLLYTDLPRVFDLKNGCPAEHFYLDCNTCSCVSGSDTPICTLKGCPEIPQIVNWSNGQSCPAGRHFYWQCNDCNCNDSGDSAACTRKACPNPNEEN